MKGLVIRWLVLAAAIMGASYLLEGIEVKGFFPALGAAAMLGILNAFFRPVLREFSASLRSGKNLLGVRVGADDPHASRL